MTSYWKLMPRVQDLYLDKEFFLTFTTFLLGEQNFFTSAMIKDCMKKVVAVNLHQVVQVGIWSFINDNSRK